jgi:hypothetical protein
MDVCRWFAGCLIAITSNCKHLVTKELTTEIVRQMTWSFTFGHRVAQPISLEVDEKECRCDNNNNNNKNPLLHYYNRACSINYTRMLKVQTYIAIKLI